MLLLLLLLRGGALHAQATTLEDVLRHANVAWALDALHALGVVEAADLSLLLRDDFEAAGLADDQAAALLQAAADLEPVGGRMDLLPPASFEFVGCRRVGVLVAERGATTLVRYGQQLPGRRGGFQVVGCAKDDAGNELGAVLEQQRSAVNSVEVVLGRAGQLSKIRSSHRIRNTLRHVREALVPTLQWTLPPFGSGRGGAPQWDPRFWWG